LILDGTSHRTSKVVGFIGALVSVIFIISILDTFLSGYLEPKATFRAFPGTSQFVNGDLQWPVEGIADLTYHSDTPMVKVALLRARGRLWWGNLEVDPAAREGEVAVMVFPKHTVPDSDTPRLRLLIFKDEAGYRASFKSFIRRLLGIPSWWLAAATLLLMACTLGLSYYLTGKREAALAVKGIVPVLKLVRRGKEWEITCGLGRNHGIKMGDRLPLLNDTLEPIGEVVVIHVEAEESKASLDASLKLGPNSFVAKTNISSP
jgi:hypothetical protein